MPLPSQHSLLPDSENSGLCASSNSLPCGSESERNCEGSGTFRGRDTSLASHVPFCPKVRSLTSPGGLLERPFDRVEAAFAACNPVEGHASGHPALNDKVHWCHKRQINELELLAALYSLKAFTSQLKRVSIRLMLDNSTAVCYVNKAGGTWLKSLNDMAVEIMYGKGTQVTGGSIFAQLSEIWAPKADLFASILNRQVASYKSWLPQLKSVAVAAFRQNWKNWKGNAFPPFNLIQRYLIKIGRDRAEVLMVTPRRPAAGRDGHQSGITSLGRLDLIRRRYESRDFSERVIQLLLASNREATSATYKSAWNGWLYWCFERSENPLSASLNLILKFLADLFEEGASSVARWIKDFLGDTGANRLRYSAHSTRGAAASKTVAAGLSIESILRSGNWSSESVFAKHYNWLESVAILVLGDCQ
ncbi:Uncharacterized protein APZ42_013070 [Daphnia magna]|uniref:Tyr recombinase domain-containing protein n=1 Tax=Daphnia magna TaxID=35525 RepID=A0A162R7F8_9CRUS|nr:Uncharacterized protein APZ42_013070 [Daphnia magna]